MRTPPAEAARQRARFQAVGGAGAVAPPPPPPPPAIVAAPVVAAVPAAAAQRRGGKGAGRALIRCMQFSIEDKDLRDELLAYLEPEAKARVDRDIADKKLPIFQGNKTVGVIAALVGEVKRLKAVVPATAQGQPVPATPGPVRKRRKVVELTPDSDWKQDDKRLIRNTLGLDHLNMPVDALDDDEDIAKFQWELICNLTHAFWTFKKKTKLTGAGMHVNKFNTAITWWIRRLGGYGSSGLWAAVSASAFEDICKYVGKPWKWMAYCDCCPRLSRAQLQSVHTVTIKLTGDYFKDVLKTVLPWSMHSHWFIPHASSRAHCPTLMSVECVMSCWRTCPLSAA